MMSNVITAMFDDPTTANLAVERLVQNMGISRDHITIHAASVASPEANTIAETGEGGFWSSLKDLFVPEEDRLAYAEGIRRGGVLVSAQVEESQMDDAMDLLEANGAVDLDTREAEWRESGWTGAVAGDAGSVVASSPTMPGVGIAAAGVAGGGTGEGTGSTSSNEAIPIVEERLTIGKRNVERGRVRVRSYIVETPVTEEVTLRTERVDVQRRVVDRPVTDADRMFEDRTIEATETSEEAVVAKEARITEEVVIRKDSTERTETVRDTVRRTEVEVEDTTGNARGAGGDKTTSGAVKPGHKA